MMPRPRSASRRSSRPTTRSRTPRSARSTTPAAASPASVAGRRLSRWRAASRAAASPRTWATSSPPSSAGGGQQGPREQRGRDLETEVRLSFDQAMHGTQIAVSVPTTERVPDLPRQRGEARDLAAHLSALRGDGHRRPEPGPLLDLPALPRVRRPGEHHRGPLPDLLRQRHHAGDQALPGQHPGRRPRRQPDQARREGRGRLPRRTARRSLRDDAGRALAGLQAAS